MPSRLHISSLIPAGLIVERVAEAEGDIVVIARSERREGGCPLCRVLSRRVHSRYVRQVSDLPCTGRRVRLRVVTRRFFCMAQWCRRQIFAERFDDAVIGERSRRTSRLVRAWNASFIILDWHWAAALPPALQSD